MGRSATFSNLTETIASSALAESLTWLEGETRSVSRVSMGLARPEQSFVAALVLVTKSPKNLSLSPGVFSRAELRQIESAGIGKRKQDLTLGRLAAKEAVRVLRPELHHRDIAVCNDIFQRPYVQLPDKREAPLISISHSGDIAAALAFPRQHPMGLDLERSDAKNAEIIEAEMTPDEREIFAQLSLLKSHALVLNWTIKESYSKALGIGLTTPFQMLAVNQVRQIDSHYFVSRLSHFHQFAVHSWIRHPYILSIAVPHKTQVSFRIGD